MFRTEHLRDTEQEIKRLEDQMIDAYWDGNDSFGDDLKASLDTYHAMRERGEITDG